MLLLYLVSLNPCSNGMCAKVSDTMYYHIPNCLNPCSNGMCAKVCYVAQLIGGRLVLILVLMECVQKTVQGVCWKQIHSLNPCSNGMCAKDYCY